jgi:hypothetical protein
MRAAACVDNEANGVNNPAELTAEIVHRDEIFIGNLTATNDLDRQFCVTKNSETHLR